MEKKQEHKLFEPDWDNIHEFAVMKELFKGLKITMTFDINDKDQLEEVQYLTAMKAIKEVDAKLVKINNNN